MIDFVQRVFHVAPAVDNQKFIVNSEFLLISDEDGYWCGAGMYFWDNLSNARYWCSKKRSPKDYTISQALLKCNTSDVLDLTDLETCHKLIKYAEVILAKMEPRDRPNLDLHKTGAVINFVYDYSKKAGLATFSVVKMHGLYGNPKTVSSIYNEGLRYPHATIRTKTIYAVRNAMLLEERQEVSKHEL